MGANMMICMTENGFFMNLTKIGAPIPTFPVMCYIIEGIGLCR